MIKAKYLSIETKILLDPSLSVTIPLLATLTALSAKTGYCWVSNKRLAIELNCTERSVQQNLAKLKERGIIRLLTTLSGRRVIVMTAMEDRLNITDNEIDFDMTQGCTDLSSPTKNFSGGYENFFTHNNKSLDIRPPKRDINISLSPKGDESVSPPKRFVKPTVDEVRAYCKERDNGVDPEQFIDFYECKGWKVGREPMKDWRACVRTWERRYPKQKDSEFYI